MLANLHGEPDALRALAKLAVLRETRLRHRDEALAEWNDKVLAAEFYAKSIAAIDKDIAALAGHCTATSDEIQAAVEVHKKALDDAEALAYGTLVYKWKHQDAHKAAKAALRRLRR